MRADRLLSLLMLLQVHGKMTAAALADELEVSVRTIYRDIEALSIAGVPMYTERGPGGGCALMEGYRSNLTGLTENEVRALFMLSAPTALDELGASQDLKAAMRKLAAALPTAHRNDEEKVRQRIYLDWSHAKEPKVAQPHLKILRQAVWEDRMLHLVYHGFGGPSVQRYERDVAPYGLVAQTNMWHLVCWGDERLRVYRVARIEAATFTGERFTRPEDFDLVTFWDTRQACAAAKRLSYPVLAHVAPDLYAYLPFYLDKRIQTRVIRTANNNEANWLTVEFSFENLEQARHYILGMGGAIEVLEPLALRLSVADFAKQVVKRYTKKR
ncbi:MAG: hypothetical protein B6I38_07145 [Anaerolineaceae bacterium 4572_5.1]|nr:MAG: hypothetical protein B6I38_07145 [Anaerolineaceae bacterium 4572_5.1]